MVPEIAAKKYTDENKSGNININSNEIIRTRHADMNPLSMLVNV